MWFRNLIISIVLAVIFSWFALSNSQIVTISILIWKYQTSLFVVILISVLIGVIFTGLVAAAEQTRLLGKIKELQSSLKHDEELLKGKEKEI